MLPRYLEKDGVVAVGEIGYDDQTDAEERFFTEQVKLAMEFDLPALIHTPHRDKKRGTERSLELVRKVGVKLGFDVEVTINGEAFKRKYDEFDPSVAVLDVIMPDIEGIELIQWLGERGADLHVIVVTGYTPRYAALAAKLAEAKGLRSAATLNKPVRLADLQDALNRTVESEDP